MSKHKPGTSPAVPIRDLIVSAIGEYKQRVVEEAISTDELYEIYGLLKSTTLFSMSAINLRCPVNRLPPELLRQVLVDCVRPSEIVVRTSPDTKEKHVGWTHAHTQAGDVLRLSHVCRRWRGILLEFPSFWTSITDKRAEQTKEFVRRAKNLPLGVVVAADRSAWFWDVCAERGTAIRELHWFSAKRNGGETYSIPALDINAPNVERLSLSRGVGDDTNYQRTSVLRGATPNVRFLSVNNMKWMPSNRFPALTHLVLSGHVPETELLAFLSRCPNLHTLVMRHCSLLHSPSINSKLEADLPRLRRLSLDLYPYRPLQAFLSRLNFDRPNAAVEIIMRKLSTLPPFNVLDIPYSLEGTLFPPAEYLADPITRLRFTQRTATRKTSSIVAANGGGGIRFVCPTVPLSFALDSVVRPNLTLAQITELWIEDMDEGAFRLFNILRSGMTGLRTLVIGHPERALTEMAMLVQSFRLHHTVHGEMLPPAPTLRMVLPGWESPEAEKLTHELLRVCGAVWPLRPKKGTLLLQAAEFPSYYYENVLPALQESWESIESEVIPEAGEPKMDMDPIAQAEPGFPAWEGW